jgi:hypothetical protein
MCEIRLLAGDGGYEGFLGLALWVLHEGLRESRHLAWVSSQIPSESPLA